jgi:hypothetical protein
MWIACLSAAEVVVHWPRISSLLLPAINKSDGELTVDDVLAFIQDEVMFVVIAGEDKTIDLALVIHPTHYANKTVCTFCLVGGKGLRQLATEHKQVFLDLAKDFGCSDIEIHGEGMARLLRQFGTVRKVRTIMRAEV